MDTHVYRISYTDDRRPKDKHMELNILEFGRMSEENLARLGQIVEETERVTQAKDLNAIVQGHAEFHYLIYAASGNRELTRVARNLWDRFYRFCVVALRSEENGRPGLEQHRAILTVLQAGDSARAGALAEEHDRSSIRHLRSGGGPSRMSADMGRPPRT
jgi:DNA-binding GntR family transcriptional regulator